MDANDDVLFILHLEKQCNKNKIGHYLFNNGFHHWKQVKIVKDYTDQIDKIVNEEKIGSSTHQNQWRFPIKKAKDALPSDFFS